MVRNQCEFDCFFAAFKKKIAKKSSSELHAILVLDEIQVRKEMSVNTKTMTNAVFVDPGEVASSSNALADHGLVLTFRAFGNS
uniref:Transposable element P transposase-like RNase H domain-containing protein n=1 Tax=Rhipicephalus appendiculatus TaxID=34631 RepID=A0A131YDP2_RHIAP